MKLQLILIWLILVKVSLGKHAWSPEEVPNPTLHWTGCGRTHSSYICDPMNYISPLSYSSLDVLLDKFKQMKVNPETSCNNYEVAVAIVDEMKYSYFSSNELRRAEDFADKLFYYWNIGSNDSRCSNGVLLFLSINDRVGYIATGREARLKLSDWRARNIITYTMAPFLQQHRVGEAVQAGLEEIFGILSRSVDELSGDYYWGNLVVKVLLYLIGFGVVFAVLSGFYHHQEFKLMQKRVNRLENDREKLLKNEFEIDTCPICLRDLTFPADDQQVPTGFGPVNTSLLSKISKTCADVSNFTSKQLWKLKRYFKKGDSSRTDEENALLVEESATMNENAYSKDAFALQCGHVFCENCIKNWLNTKTECPICKRPVFEAPPQALQEVYHEDAHIFTNEANLSPDMNRIVRRIRNRTALDLLLRELDYQTRLDFLTFRARRIGVYHPRYVSPHMVYQFVQEPRTTYLSRHEHFVRHQEAFSSNHSWNTHRSGATHRGTRSFGGGGHSRSGGGGGKW